MNMRCCGSCRALPGTCSKKWACACHVPDRRDRHDSLTDWEIAANQAVRNQLNREAKARADLEKYTKEQSKRATEFSHWR